MAAARWLIVTADEFGRSESINRGVARAHREGIVSSASLMVRYPATEDAVRLARDLPALGLGLHVDVGEWVFRDGEWRAVASVVALDDRDAVNAEVERQLARFTRLTGRCPTHLDSYQSRHRSGHLCDTLRELAERLGVPLRHASRDVRHVGGFFGQTSRGEPYLEGVSTAALLALLETLPAGCAELSCHPGEGNEPDLPYRIDRSREVVALCDPLVRTTLTNQAITLRSFAGLNHDLASRGSAGAGEATADATPVAARVKVRGGSGAAALWRDGAAELSGDAATAGADRPRHTTTALDGSGAAATPTADRSNDAANPTAELIRTGYRLRREGSLSGALEAFTRAGEISPRSEGAQRGGRIVASEIRVLRDGWTPPSKEREWIDPTPGRVLHLVAHSLPHRATGYAIRTGYVARAQRDAGLDPRVVTQLGFPAAADDSAVVPEIVDGIRHHRLPGPVPATLEERLATSFELLTELVRRLRPAVLHAASDFQNALLAIELGRRFALPVVYEVRGFWEETRLVKQGPGAAERESYRWHRRRELECAREADRVVTLSEGMKAQLVEHGVPPERIHVVPNAVDVEAFADVRRDEELAAKLGLHPAVPVVGYISSLTAYEGIDVLLEALARLLEGGQRVKGLIVGDGEEREALEARAARLGIANHVVFTGRVPHAEVVRYYGLIDLFVVPRTAARVCQLVTPLKPYEAMAAGKALVVSGVAALREMVEADVTGVVFEPEDPEALATVLHPLIQDRRRREQLGRQARDWVARNRTWRQSGQRYLDLYAGLPGVLPIASDAPSPGSASTLCEIRPS